MHLLHKYICLNAYRVNGRLMTTHSTCYTGEKEGISFCLLSISSLKHGHSPANKIHVYIWCLDRHWHNWIEPSSYHYQHANRLKNKLYGQSWENLKHTRACTSLPQKIRHTTTLSGNHLVVLPWLPTLQLFPLPQAVKTVIQFGPAWIHVHIYIYMVGIDVLCICVCVYVCHIAENQPSHDSAQPGYKSPQGVSAYIKTNKSTLTVNFCTTNKGVSVLNTHKEMILTWPFQTQHARHVYLRLQ